MGYFLLFPRAYTFLALNRGDFPAQNTWLAAQKGLVFLPYAMQLRCKTAHFEPGGTDFMCFPCAEWNSHFKAASLPSGDDPSLATRPATQICLPASRCCFLPAPGPGQPPARMASSHPASACLGQILLVHYKA